MAGVLIWLWIKAQAGAWQFQVCSRWGRWCRPSVLGPPGLHEELAASQAFSSTVGQTQVSESQCLYPAWPRWALQGCSAVSLQAEVQLELVSLGNLGMMPPVSFNV